VSDAPHRGPEAVSGLRHDSPFGQVLLGFFACWSVPADWVLSRNLAAGPVAQTGIVEIALAKAGAAAILQQVPRCIEIEDEKDRQRRVGAAIGVLQSEGGRHRDDRGWWDGHILNAGADIDVAAHRPGTHHVGKVEVRSAA
jgi:hypothetical protein